jgi:hypothetical protein
MFRHGIKVLGLTAVLCITLGIAGCDRSANELWYNEAGDRLSGPADMNRRQIEADPFLITVFEKVHQPGSVATLYFEGDGERAMTGVKEVAMNPTPKYPLALHLAAMDNAENVISVARPCQYSGPIEKIGSVCKKDYWRNGRYSIEILNSMNTVVDKLKSRYGFTAFNFVGYDGGAAIATLLAAKRKDVLTLRTVAGNLDPDVNNANHGLPPATGSLNPKDFAKDLAGIPQQHFIGEWDKDVAPNVYQSFRDAMGPSSCIRYTKVAEMDHTGGWANHWPSLLAQPLDCNAIQK